MKILIKESGKISPFTSKDHQDFSDVDNLPGGDKPRIYRGRYGTLIVGTDINDDTESATIFIHWNKFKDVFAYKVYGSSENDVNNALRDSDKYVDIVDKEFDNDDLKSIGFTVVN